MMSLEPKGPRKEFSPPGRINDNSHMFKSINNPKKDFIISTKKKVKLKPLINKKVTNTKP